MNTIYSFSGNFACFSNFYPSKVVYNEVTYYYAENAYQASKTNIGLFNLEFANPSMKPGQAKRLGKKLRLRPDWESVKFSVMEEIVRDKFTRNADLAKILLATGNAVLVEGNYWGDKVWGQVQENGKWVGENHLGLILMKIRKELQHGNL